MRVGPGPTNRQRILVAAATLQQPFHETDLVLAVWQSDPERFGLVGCRNQHPDPNLIRCEVMGRARLTGRGFLERVAERTYRLTSRGRSEAEVASTTNSRRELGVNRKQLCYRREFARCAPAMLSSYAYRRWRESSHRKAIDPEHAVAFYGCRLTQRPCLIEAAAERQRAMLRAIVDENLILKPILLASGQEVGMAEARQLLECHEWLRANVGTRQKLNRGNR